MANSNIGVSVSNYQKTGPGTGTLDFTFSGPNVDNLGNINLRPLPGNVDLQFNLAMGGGPHGPPNVAWVSPPSAAIWISLGTVCPTGPDNGGPQFSIPSIPAPNLLKVHDLNASPNSASANYMYRLRVVVTDQGEPVICSHDPMIINRVDGGGGKGKGRTGS